MKFALIGYGKMGQTLERLATERGHSVVARLGKGWTESDVQGVDMAFEFTTPEAVVDNVLRCLEASIPVVCGTTGWDAHFAEVATAFERKPLGLFVASNFSPGVYALTQAVGLLSALSASWEAQLSLSEVHHIHKRDRPSGTALRLAEKVLEKQPILGGWSLAEDPVPGTLPISVERVDEVPGTHRLTISTAQDVLSIEHRALNRDGFALGAILAAEWLHGKTGVFGMDDLYRNE